MGFVGPYKTTVRKIVHQTATLLDLDSAQMKVDVRRGFAGEAYGVPTDECLEAIKLLARLEGMVLDPVYKVKALAGRSIWHAVSCAKRDVSYSFIWEGLRLSARTRLSINNRGHSQEREVFAAEVFDWRLENFAPGAVAARMKRGTTAEQTRGDEGIS